VILVVLSLIGVATVPLFGGQLRRFASVELRHVWIVWLSVVAQIVVFEATFLVSESVGEILHLGTYVLSGVFLWLNRHIPGAWLLGLGGGLNLVAIVANGGVMPATEWAWRTAGFDRVAAGDFENSNIATDVPLWWLGDVFAIPEWLPLSNVFSVGDVLILAAVVYCAHTVCRAVDAPVAIPLPPPTADSRVDWPWAPPAPV
jgi:hypothetical protein